MNQEDGSGNVRLNERLGAGEKKDFEEWVKSSFTMHKRMLEPGPGIWEYSNNDTLYMLMAWRGARKKYQAV